MDEARKILKLWMPAERASVEPLAAQGGFSGARLWRVRAGDRDFALRRWPEHMTPGRLASIHALEQWLAQSGLPVPAPVAIPATGQTAAVVPEAVWELATWRPGVADYWADSRPQKLTAALRMLARIHVSAAAAPQATLQRLPDRGASSALRRRHELLHGLLIKEAADLSRDAWSKFASTERAQMIEAQRLVERVAPPLAAKALRWRDEALPLQWVLCDVWHDHVLFTGDVVTGVVDFGAAAFDAPAGDVARLLGSMVGDDADRRRAGLAAYESVRPLSDAERAAVDFFDASGTVLSTRHWMEWLGAKSGDPGPLIRDRRAALERFGRLLERLRHLAAARFA
jgi:homoserine kinase type II